MSYGYLTPAFLCTLRTILTRDALLRQIVNANDTENSGLFRALKGGSANFGIVTRFDMQAFDAPELWGGLVTYPKSVTPQHVAAYVNWTNNIVNYQDGSAITFWTYDPTKKDIIITAAYEDITGAVAAPAFDEFLAIPDQTSNTMRIDTHRNLAIELELTSGYRYVISRCHSVQALGVVL